MKCEHEHPSNETCDGSGPDGHEHEYAYVPDHLVRALVQDKRQFDAVVEAFDAMASKALDLSDAQQGFGMAKACIEALGEMIIDLKIEVEDLREAHLRAEGEAMEARVRAVMDARQQGVE